MKKFVVSVPSSTANLGPGFDCLGCALSLYLRVTVELIPSDAEASLYLSYSGEGKVPLDSSNLIIQSCLHLVARIKGKASQDFSNDYKLSLLPNYLYKVHVDNQIPLSRGLGSSGAAIVAGMMMANTIYEFGLSKDLLLNYILEIELHPDNVGASLLGGAIAGILLTEEPRVDRRCGYARIRWNPAIKCLVVIPQFELSTEKCRKVLPKQYDRSLVVSNIQRVAVLTMLLQQQDSELDKELFFNVLKDSIHQPYRFSLIPGLETIIKRMTYKTEPGLLGIVLSGAGPTVLALCTENFDEIGKKMVEIFEEYQINSTFKLVSVDESGASVTFCHK